jgi:hypothetical protein
LRIIFETAKHVIEHRFGLLFGGMPVASHSFSLSSAVVMATSEEHLRKLPFSFLFL